MSFCQEATRIANICVLHIGTPRHIKQNWTELKGEIYDNTRIGAEFNNLLSIMNKSSRKRINKGTENVNNVIDQMDLTDIYRTFYPTTTEYIFFSGTHGTFCRIDDVLGHKASISKFKKIEIISNIFSDHNGMKVESNNRRKIGTISTHGN